MQLETQLIQLAQRAKASARPLARASSAARTQALNCIADVLVASRDEILAANALDMSQATRNGLSKAMCDRLKLDASRLTSLENSVREIAKQTDPVGEQTSAWTRPNGLRVAKVRLPLGVILMIYESRPNVTIDAAALCIRSGNAVILRGGSEAEHTNHALAKAITQGLTQANLPSEACQLVPVQDRRAIDVLLELDHSIDLVIPRGGEALIRHVTEHSRIPVIQHYKGVCHIFVHASADADMALRIIENAKVQRPGVCNATETVLVDRAIATQFVPQLIDRLTQHGVEIRGCNEVQRLSSKVKAATPEDWDTEYLDLILAVRVVDDLEAAIAHIDAHGTHHTAAIMATEQQAQERFTHAVDSSCVLINASTRFNDGGELGLGAEMGISTTRLHAYGPMGATSLCTERFIVIGEGHVRT